MRGAVLRAAACLWAIGCTSHRFQLANDLRIDREHEMLALDRAARRTPTGPGPTLDVLPDEPAYAAAPPGTGTMVAAPELQPPAGAPPPVASIPATSYPPPGDSFVGAGADPDADVLRADRRRGANGIDARANAPSALVPAGPHLAGQVVNSFGQPAPAAAVQALDLARGRQVAAEVAADAAGSFRILNLEPGGRYEVVATAVSGNTRYLGRTTATPPQAGLKIRLDPLPADVADAAEPRGAGWNPFAADEPAPTAGNVRISAPRLLPAASRRRAGDLPAVPDAPAGDPRP